MGHARHKLLKRLGSDEAATTVEYGVLLALILVVVIAAVLLLRDEMIALLLSACEYVAVEGP